MPNSQKDARVSTGVGSSRRLVCHQNDRMGGWTATSLIITSYYSYALFDVNIRIPALFLYILCRMLMQPIATALRIVSLMYTFDLIVSS